MKVSLTIILTLVSLLFFSRAAAEQETPRLDLEPFAGEYPIQILATTGMVADLARNIAGEKAEVTALMGSGIDPHLYKASPSDIRAMRSADLIFFNGLHLEAKLSDMLVQLARRQPVFAVTERLPEDRLHTPEQMEGLYDPHVWFNLETWALCGEYVLDVLIAFDPENSQTYQENANQYLGEIRALHAEIPIRLAAIPERSRLLVTAHDAFGYFGAAYGIEVTGVQGLSTVSEAGVKRVNDLVNMLVDRNVKAVFIESTISDRNIRALIEGAAAKGHEVTIGGELFSDAMGEEGTPQGEYLGMVEHNVSTIIEALK